MKNPGWLTSLGVVTCDQLSKFAVSRFLTPGESMPVIKGIFHITLTHNTGVAFGLLKGSPYLVVVSVVAIIMLLFYLWAAGKKPFFLNLGVYLIIGGAVGNLIDRLAYSYIVDFIDLKIWPVFNMADSAITIGALLVIIRMASGGVARRDDVQPKD